MNLSRFIVTDKKLRENTVLHNDDATLYPVNLMANVGLRDNKRIYQITKQQRQDCIYSGCTLCNACNDVGNIEAIAEATQCIIQLGQP